MQNRLKQIWAEGRPSVNGWISIGNPFVAEIIAAQGYDSVTLDIQHGAYSTESALVMLQTMRASGTVPIVRVPWLEPGIIMKALDGGAMGIICPMINNAAEAAEFVSYLRYPPHGTRSFGPTRVSFAAGADYAATANSRIVGLAMIETKAGMQNLEEICAVPGLDGVYVGPADLSIGITDGRLPGGMDREEPEMIAAIQTIARTARANGKRAALHCGTPAYARRAISWGYDMTTLLNDVRLLAGAAERQVTEFRALTADLGKS